MRLKSLVQSLSHRNFRLFFFGQTISLSGSWMQQVAMSWLVYQLTGSSFLLGTVLFLGQIPCLFLSPVIGFLTDRWDKRKILLVTQSLALLQAAALAALTLAGVAEVWHIMALSLALGLVIALDMPARQTIVPEMIDDPHDLPNAIAMNATMFNSARLIGPALAGLVLGYTSAGTCFLLNAISFIPVLWSLLAIRLPRKAAPAAHPPVRKGIAEGARYAWRFAPLRNILLLLSLGSLTSSATSVLLPEYTVAVLGGDAHVLGWLSSAMGCGALAAALFLASRRTVLGHGQIIGAGIGIMGLGILAMPFTPTLPLALAAMFVGGFGMVAHIAAGNTIIQTVADPDKRGRVMGFYTMAIVGMIPLGSLLTGWTGTHIGLTPTLIAAGAVSLAGGFLFLLWLPHLHEQVRPIYVRLKILPPVEEV